ncbi:hypothetical protein Tco_0907442 [Tanacetum coccineum]|uniref:CCHC-type domain-containing protein n=1 Tax=Tanacetum coccineum TaxID=301880 RepID=A0ABQ5CM70_9ASTR
MTSFDYRLNPIYAIKECSSCGSLYTSNCGCSKGSLEDKILVPKPPRNCARCARCGTPVDGPYCQGCALLRKEFMEGLFTNCVENEFFKDFQDTSESSDDNTNVVNAPREPIVVNQDPGENSSPSPLHIDHCCHECGDSLDGIFCRQCTCKSCGKGAHYGYNCPPRIPIISNPEPCKNQTIGEHLQNLQSVQQQCLFRTCQQCGCNEYDGVCFYCKVGNGTQINVSTPYSSNDSPSVANHPPQPQYVPYSRELCGNDSHYSYDCPPQVPFVYNQDPCFNQNFDYFPQTSPSFPQQYLCCENCGGPHETFQCQPMNEDYYHEQNSCYDYNSFGFDQFQHPQYTVNHPIFNSQNELLNSRNELLNSSNKLMEQMTTLCDLVGQAIQKKEEEKRIAEEQAAKDRSWKIPICYDDDEDNTIAITPVLPIEEPDNSLSMGDEHLDTIPATESDEFIKSSVEDLVPIPSESEGSPDKMCDVPLCENTTSLNALNEHSKIIVNSYDDNSSSDDDSPYGENIDYVDASPPDVEIVSLEVVEIVDPEIILSIFRSCDQVFLLIPNLLFGGGTNTFDNFYSELNFRFNLEEISSGSPTTRSDLSLPDYKAFYVDNDHFKEKSSGSTITHVDFSQYDSFIFDLSNDQFPPADRSDFNHEEFADELTHIMPLPELEYFKFKIELDPGDLTSIDPGIRKNVSTTNVNVPLEDDQSSLFAYVVWIFLAFLTYPVVPPYLLSTRNEDTIFDPGISIYHSFMPDVSHRNDFFMKFKCLSQTTLNASRC